MVVKQQFVELNSIPGFLAAQHTKLHLMPSRIFIGLGTVQPFHLIGHISNNASLELSLDTEIGCSLHLTTSYSSGAGNFEIEN